MNIVVIFQHLPLPYVHRNVESSVCRYVGGSTVGSHVVSVYDLPSFSFAVNFDYAPKD